MNKTSQVAGVINRRLCVTAITIAVAAMLAPLPGHAAFLEEPPLPLTPRSNKVVSNEHKYCFIPDPNGRKWLCTRINNPAVNRTLFKCPIENRMDVDIKLSCDSHQVGDFFVLRPGETTTEHDQIYQSVFDPAPPVYTPRHTSPNITCQWWCAGNKMDGVVVWNEQWPEAWSCRTGGGDGRCKLVFERNREVVLVTRTRRRVLGDLAIKECSKNLWGYGGWLPFGLGCTYPKHDHDYYGFISYTG